MTRTAQRAQALVYLAVALPIFMGIAGLAIDGALLLAARRELQSVVDGAARAGATRVDIDVLRASGGAAVQLEAAAARSTSLAYLNTQLVHDLPWAVEPQATVEANPWQVRVVVVGTLRPAFLRIVGIERIPVDAVSVARAQHGIVAPAAPR